MEGGGVMAYQSIIEQRGSVGFPAFNPEKIYMRAFRKAEGLPCDIRHWQSTVDQMLDGIEVDGQIYLMVDSAHVAAGESHRRAGIHIDGYWNPALQAHGNPGHGGSPGHGGTPWPSRHSSGGYSWQQPDFTTPEAILLASNVQTACGYVGEYAGAIGDGGDCSAVDIAALSAVPMESGRIYAGNVSFLHESLPVAHDCARSLVRLNIPGWTPSQ